MSQKIYLILTNSGFTSKSEVDAKMRMFEFSNQWDAQITDWGTLYTSDERKTYRNEFASGFFNQEIWNECFLEIRETDKWDVMRKLERSGLQVK